MTQRGTPRRRSPPQTGPSPVSRSPRSEDPRLSTYDGRTPQGIRAIASVPALTILYHPDLERVGERALLGSLLAGMPVRLSREAPDFSHPGSAYGGPLAEACVSRKPLLLLALPDGGVEVCLDQSSTGVMHRNEVAQGDIRFSADQLKRGVVLRLGGRVVLLLHRISASAPVKGDYFGLVGEHESIQQVRRDIARVADQDVPVLIRGETGTGKELVARAIHEASPRKSGSFVTVNLAAIPAALAGAELFGAERGAFTGSVRQQVGFFNAAQGGTLLLDEIGEAPPDVQVMLLRAIETGEVQAVGTQRTRRADCRILCATDGDLEKLISEGRFRAPLLHRLAAFEIRLPPLRERRDDIGRLLVSFLREELERIGEAHKLLPCDSATAPWLPASLVARFADLDWPGNVRQLRNVVKQLVIGSRDQARLHVGPVVERLLADPPPSNPGVPRSEDTPVPTPPPTPATPRPATQTSLMASPPDRRRPVEVTEQELAEALRACRWDLVATAERLRISRPSLYVLVRRNPRFRTAGDVTAEELRGCYLECGGDTQRMAEKLEVSAAALARRIRELGIEPPAGRN